MSIITVGIDLAKNVFAVHGVDDNGKPALVKPKVSREHLLAADRPVAALPDRHGSLLRRTSLGAAVFASTATA
jgi:transposase